MSVPSFVFQARTLAKKLICFFSTRLLSYRLKREFSIEKNDGSDTSANGTARIREHLESLEGDAGLTYKILPRIDQTAMYGSVYARLTEGGCIGLFPEGSSRSSFDEVDHAILPGLVVLNSY